MQKAQQVLLSCLFIITTTGCLGSFKKVERVGALPSRGRAIEKNTIAATGKLVIIKKNKKWSRCTAFAYKNIGYVYRFITAAHCLAKDDKKNRRIKVLSKSLTIYIEGKRSKKYKAKIVAVGYRGVGDDFAILEAKLDRHIPIIKLSNGKLTRFQSFLNASYPRLADGNLFYGSVDELNYRWTGNILLKIIGVGDSRGASGSAVVDFYSGKVIGILIKRKLDNTRVIAVPISRFKEFEEKIKNGTYRYPLSKK